MAKELLKTSDVNSTSFGYYEEVCSKAPNQYQTLTLERGKESKYAQVQLIADTQQHRNRHNTGTTSNQTTVTVHEGSKSQCLCGCFLLLIIGAVGGVAFAFSIHNFYLIKSDLYVTVNSESLSEPLFSSNDTNMKEIMLLLEEEIASIRSSLNETNAVLNALTSRLRGSVNFYKNCYKDIHTCNMSLSGINNRYILGKVQYTIS